MDAAFAEVIAIGDELVAGHRLNTNAQWLSQQLQQLGLRVMGHVTVPDDHARMLVAIGEAAARARVVVITGGLGPTADDLTRPVLADLLGQPLQLDPQMLAAIEDIFQRRGRTMMPNNRSQAMRPQGSVPIPNPFGTAPGIEAEMAHEDQQCLLFALPGVPAEMIEMFHAHVAPRLRKAFGTDRAHVVHELHCFGAGESEIESMLPDLVRRGRTPQVGITASAATITLRISAEAATAEAAQQQIAPVAQTIRQCLGALVFGENGQTLQRVLVQQLLERPDICPIAIVDAGFGGKITQWLTTADPSGQVLAGGLVLPSRAAAVQLIDKFGAAGQPVAGGPADQWLHELAKIGQTAFGARLVVVIGPLPDSDEDKASSITIVVRQSSQNETVELPFSGHPEVRKIRAAKSVLNQLRLLLLKEASHA